MSSNKLIQRGLVKQFNFDPGRHLLNGLFLEKSEEKRVGSKWANGRRGFYFDLTDLAWGGLARAQKAEKHQHPNAFQTGEEVRTRCELFMWGGWAEKEFVLVLGAMPLYAMLGGDSVLGYAV